MRKINELEEKIVKIFILYFPIIIFIQTILNNNYINKTIFVIEEAIILFLYILFMFKNKNKKDKLFLTIFSIFILLAIIINYLYYGHINYFEYLLKYGNIVFLLLYFKNNLKDRYDISILKTPIKIIAITYLIALITKTGRNDLNIIGNIGWFSSSNELGSLLCLLYPISLYLFYHYDYSCKYEYIYPIILGYMMINIGTIIGFIGFLCTTIIFLFYRLSTIRRNGLKNGLFIIASMLIITGLLYPKLPSVINALNNNAFLETLDIKNNIYVFNKSNNLINYIKKEPVINLELNSDLIITYQLLGITGILFISIAIINTIFTKKLKKVIKNPEIFLISIGILLAILATTISGEIIYSTIMSLYFSFAINIIQNIDIKSHHKKRLLFAVSDLKISGKNKSLISLLNNINEDEFEIDLFLANEEGELKGDIPYFINILKTKLPFKELLIRNKLLALCLVNNREYDNAIDYTFDNEFITNYIIHETSNKRIIWMHTKASKQYMKEDLDVFDSFDKIVAVSDDVKNDLTIFAPRFTNKIIVLWNTVEKPLSIDEEVVWPKTNHKLISIGKLEAAKRYDRMFEALKILQDKQYDFYIKILGDGNKKSALKDLIAEYNLRDKVELCGNTYNINDYLKEAELILLTSDYEGFPTTHIEALSCNVPIITTDVCGIRKILESVAPREMYHLTMLEPEDIANKIINNNFTNNSTFDIDKYNKKTIIKIEELFRED